MSDGGGGRLSQGLEQCIQGLDHQCIQDLELSQGLEWCTQGLEWMRGMQLWFIRTSNKRFPFLEELQSVLINKLNILYTYIHEDDII